MSEGSPSDKNWLEWCVFALGVALTTATIGCLVYDMLTHRSLDAPSIEIQIGEVAPRHGHFVVPVTVMNSGDTTAEAVQIEVVLRSGKSLENAQFELDYLPGHGHRSGAVSFNRDPRLGELTARPLGYQIP